MVPPVENMELPVVNPDDVDTMLAAELNEMTFQERERMYEELHGVAMEIVETKELLQTSLMQLDESLQRLPDRSIYEKAKGINPLYIENYSFRLMFLRSEYFDVEKAATRLVKFLENKVRFFGEETLARPIYLSDFNEDDMAFLQSGVVQLIPARDRSGRMIVSDFNMDPNGAQPKNIDNYIKVVIYTVLAAAEDEETQKRGLIGMFYFTNALSTIQQLHQRNPRIFSWLPIKLVGAHFCYNDPRFRLAKALLLLLMGKERRVRARVHQGSHAECQYNLMTFGVPVNHFPVTYEGELKTASHIKWLARRKIKEEAIQSNGTFEGIDIPGTKDVLLGRGKTIQDHSGNVSLRNTIAEYMSDYRSAPKKEKGNVAWKVVMATKALGGRFLKRETDGWWVEVSDDVARDKISMTYRTSRSTIMAEARLIESTRTSTQDENDRSRTLDRDSKRARMHQGNEEGVVDYSDGSSSTYRTCFGARKP